MSAYANPQEDTNTLRVVSASGNVVSPAYTFANDETVGMWWDVNGVHISGLAAPTNPGDAANKAYVDTSVAGSGVSFIHSDSNPNLAGNVQFVSGTNVTLSQVGQAITITASGGSGVSQLTGDVTAGPGSGSQAATLAASIAGTHTFSGQLIGKGTATNDSAATGYIGEYVQSLVSTFTALSAPVTYLDLTSITLTAGDWDITGAIFIENDGFGAAIPSANVLWGVSTTAGNSFPDAVAPDNAYSSEGEIPTTFIDFTLPITGFRRSISTTTTFYLKFYFDSYSGSAPEYKCRLSARRAR